MSVTVTTPAPSYRLATVAEFKAAQGIATSADDTVIGQFLDRSSDKIVAYCNRAFAMETITETIRTDLTDRLKLKKYPVNQVISVSYNGVVIDPSLYSVDEPEKGYINAIDINGLPLLWQSTYGRFSYTVVYNTGYFLDDFPSMTPNPYGAPSLPDDIAATCIELSDISYAAKGKDRNIVSESTPDVVTIAYKGSVRGAADGAAEELSFLGALNPYKRFNL